MPESSALIESLRYASHFAAGAGERDSADDWLRQGLVRAKLHELYARDADDAAAASGFAVALAIAAGAMPLLWIRTEDAERRGGRLLGAGFVELGLSPAAIMIISVADEAALLRAAADAARCGGLGMLVVESRGRAPRIDLTATRRLMLAAEASGVTIVSLRLGAEPTPSAAATRWGVAAAPSIALAADAPGHPGFAVELLRQRGGPAGARWRVEWKRDAKTFEIADSAPLSGAGLPLAADRAAARDTPAPLRRAG
jgi:protein ImuA